MSKKFNRIKLYGSNRTYTRHPEIRSHYRGWTFEVSVDVDIHGPNLVRPRFTIAIDNAGAGWLVDPRTLLTAEEADQFNRFHLMSWTEHTDINGQEMPDGYYALLRKLLDTFIDIQEAPATHIINHDGSIDITIQGLSNSTSLAYVASVAERVLTTHVVPKILAIRGRKVEVKPGEDLRVVDAYYTTAATAFHRAIDCQGGPVPGVRFDSFAACTNFCEDQRQTLLSQYGEWQAAGDDEIIERRLREESIEIQKTLLAGPAQWILGFDAQGRPICFRADSKAGNVSDTYHNIAVKLAHLLVKEGWRRPDPYNDDWPDAVYYGESPLRINLALARCCEDREKNGIWHQITEVMSAESFGAEQTLQNASTCN